MQKLNICSISSLVAEEKVKLWTLLERNDAATLQESWQLPDVTTTASATSPLLLHFYLKLYMNSTVTELHKMLDFFSLLLNFRNHKASTQTLKQLSTRHYYTV